MKKFILLLIIAAIAVASFFIGMFGEAILNSISAVVIGLGPYVLAIWYAFPPLAVIVPVLALTIVLSPVIFYKMGKRSSQLYSKRKRTS